MRPKKLDTGTMSKTYIEVRTWKDEPVHRVDVTGKSERVIDRIENGMAINLNHDAFYLQVVTYEAGKEPKLTPPHQH